MSDKYQTSFGMCRCQKCVRHGEQERRLCFISFAWWLTVRLSSCYLWLLFDTPLSFIEKLGYVLHGDCLGAWTCGGHGPCHNFESPLEGGVCYLSMLGENIHTHTHHTHTLFHFSFFQYGVLYCVCVCSWNIYVECFKSLNKCKHLVTFVFSIW